ncbi:EthD family reductase [Mesorhizobium sp. ORM6]
MIKVIVLLKRSAMIDPSVFENWILEEHARFARLMPGLLSYRVNVIRPTEGSAIYDAVTELRFNSESAMHRSFNSDAGRDAVADASHYCESRVRLICEEKVQF